MNNNYFFSGGRAPHPGLNVNNFTGHIQQLKINQNTVDFTKLINKKSSSNFS